MHTNLAFSALIALAVATSAASEEIYLADRAAPLQAEVVSITGGKLHLGEGAPEDARIIDAGAVLELRFERLLQEVTESRVMLWGGELLCGTITGGSRTELTLSSRGLGTVQVAFPDVRQIEFPKPAGRAVAAGAEQDVLYLAGGDYLLGTIDGFSADGVTLSSTTLGGLRTFPFDDVARLTFADFEGVEAGDGAKRDLICYLRDGSRLNAELISYSDGVLTVASVLGKQLQIRRNALASLVFLSGTSIFVSDLEAAPQSRDCVLPFPSQVTYPHRKDQAVMGGPLRMDGRTFAKGLGVHSRSVLVYAVADAGGARHFWATAGLDASAAGTDPLARLASVIMRVRTAKAGEDPETGQILYESAILRAADAPVEIGPLLIEGDLLILEVDYADNYHVRDRAAWGAARLVP